MGCCNRGTRLVYTHKTASPALAVDHMYVCGQRLVPSLSNHVLLIIIAMALKGLINVKVYLKNYWQSLTTHPGGEDRLTSSH